MDFDLDLERDLRLGDLERDLDRSLLYPDESYKGAKIAISNRYLLTHDNKIGSARQVKFHSKIHSV